MRLQKSLVASKFFCNTEDQNSSKNASVPCSEQIGPWGWCVPMVWQHLQPQSSDTMLISLRTWQIHFLQGSLDSPPGQGQVLLPQRFLSPERSLAFLPFPLGTCGSFSPFPNTIQLPKSVTPPQCSCSLALPKAMEQEPPTCP